MREWHHREWLRGCSGAVAIGLVLGILGPFGTQTTLPTGVKYGFWMLLALVGFAAALAVRHLIGTAARPWRPSVRLVAVAAGSALPMTLVVAWAMGVVRPGRTFAPGQMMALYPFVTLIQLFLARVATSRWLSPDPGPAATLSHEPAPPPSYPAELLGKLPAKLRRDILALEAEDHYLRVHTRDGSALVLMRLSDAAATIDPRLGLRVHRSWWVARDRVHAFDQAGGRPVVELEDGRKIPVSRSYLSAAREAWTQ